jgi:hypothetical protein
MNPNNYATLEACQRLVSNGIVLETDFIWISGELRNKKSSIGTGGAGGTGISLVFHDIPAPSMAEVWREYRKHVPDYQNRGKLWNALREENVVDALIDLLIWVKKKEGV